jgi:hypothetical protein
MYRSWGLSRPILDGLYRDFPYKPGFTRKYNTSILGALEGILMSYIAPPYDASQSWAYLELL